MIQVPDRTRCLLLKTDGDAADDALHARLKSRNWQVSVQQDPHMAMAEMCLREWAQKTRASWGLKRLEGMVLVIDTPLRQPPFGDDLDSLLAAMNRYLPATPIWLHADGELSRLDAEGDAPEAEEEAVLPKTPKEVIPPARPETFAPPAAAGGLPATPRHIVQPGAGAGRLKLAGEMDTPPVPSRQSKPSPQAESDSGEPADEAAAPLEDLAPPDEPQDIGRDGDIDEPEDDRTVLSREEIDMLLGMDDGGRAP